MFSSTKRLDLWNRRLHVYLGLYFLFFLWLFALTGLMLNHGQWRVSVAANDRTEARYERSVDLPVGLTDQERAEHVMAALGLVGELDMPDQRPGELTFNVSRPSDASRVRVSVTEQRAVVQHFVNNQIGRLRILHTFSGSRFNQPSSRRDWIVTTVWVFAMDALAAALIVMVLGSYYLWWQRKRTRVLGGVVLCAGAAACGWFMAGGF